ncbi:probable membrane-associated kinase regulator 1 [Diospyros lotus]|uniref:probable membrane-associated kinase regulator 1 n=1 Tax=Diospyros lotus TaxID=55363 RepID=UPI002254358D|nr:probable membrane-associated kinase regulator 1 [Diospyros lotus]
MGRRADQKHYAKSQTLPSSPTHSFSSSSSSDFEFTISMSPRKSSAALCPADELFYKGQLLPLHLSPRLSMVQSLLLSSSSTSSSSARPSSGSSADSFSPRPSSAAAADDHHHDFNHPLTAAKPPRKPNFFSLSRFSSVFRRPRDAAAAADSPSPAKRVSATPREVIRKYLKKVKPLYEKLSQKAAPSATAPSSPVKADESVKTSSKDNNGGGVLSHSFSGNLRYRRKRCYVSSCPSSMRSSPSHSGILYQNKFPADMNRIRGVNHSDTSSMEELQSAIQGAIAHCKNSMIQNKAMVGNEI